MENKEETKTIEADMILELMCMFATQAPDDHVFTASLATVVRCYTESHNIDMLEWVDTFKEFMHFSAELDKAVAEDMKKHEKLEKKEQSGKVTRFRYRKDK